MILFVTILIGDYMEKSNVIVVADAGPIIHLDELECLEILTDFETVFIPETVWNEVIKHRPSALPCNKVNFVCQSIISLSAQVTALTPLYTLHKGEQDALHLCMEFERSLLLTDDTAARLAAKNIGVSAHGTLGLLVRAIRQKSLSKTDVLALLRSIPAKTTLHIRASLLTEVINDVDRQAK